MNLIQFFIEQKPLTCANGESLTLEEILLKDNIWWEYCHNHIQWCFPTRKPSRMNLNAPILDQPTAQIILNNGWDVYYRAIERFFSFLKEVNDWHPGNHNYLRISRVIESYRLITNNEENTNYLFKRFLNLNIPYSSDNLYYMVDSSTQSWENNFNVQL